MYKYGCALVVGASAGAVAGTVVPVVGSFAGAVVGGAAGIATGYLSDCGRHGRPLPAENKPLVDRKAALPDLSVTELMMAEAYAVIQNIRDMNIFVPNEPEQAFLMATDQIGQPSSLTMVRKEVLDSGVIDNMTLLAMVDVHKQNVWDRLRDVRQNPPQDISPASAAAYTQQVRNRRVGACGEHTLLAYDEYLKLGERPSGAQPYKLVVSLEDDRGQINNHAMFMLLEPNHPLVKSGKPTLEEVYTDATPYRSYHLPSDLKGGVGLVVDGWKKEPWICRHEWTFRLQQMFTGWDPEAERAYFDPNRRTKLVVKLTRLEKPAADQ